MQSSLLSKNEHKYSNLRGLYAITDNALLPQDRLVKAVEQAIMGGALVIQYRDKNSAPETRIELASELAELCAAHQTIFIINDDVKLAKKVGADGVHLGKGDMSIKEARKHLGDQALIGISCYNSLAQAHEAQKSGADYVAFGSFYSSPTKPDAVKADLRLLQEARQQLKIPLVAIGGITPDNGATLIDAGADMIAVIHAVFGQADITQASKRIAALFIENKF